MTPGARLGAATLLCSVLAGTTCGWAANVTTYHYDNHRTGWAQTEQTLTPANVGGGTFGFTATIKLPATQLVGHPLIVEGVSVAGAGISNVVYLVDNANNVWGLNAATGAVLLHVNLGTPVPGTIAASGTGIMLYHCLHSTEWARTLSCGATTQAGEPSELCAGDECEEARKLHEPCPDAQPRLTSPGRVRSCPEAGQDA